MIIRSHLFLLHSIWCWAGALAAEARLPQGERRRWAWPPPDTWVACIVNLDETRFEYSKICVCVRKHSFFRGVSAECRSQVANYLAKFALSNTPNRAAHESALFLNGTHLLFTALESHLNAIAWNQPSFAALALKI